MIVLGEDVGTEMSLRTFDHLLQYGELPVKRVVPLALALLYVSNPDYSVIDQLSRLSHDQVTKYFQPLKQPNRNINPTTTTTTTLFPSFHP